MRRRQSLIHTSLTFVGLATLLGPTPASPPPTQADPYDLAFEWKNADVPSGSAAWSTNSMSSGLARNVYFRVRGVPDHGGVYVVLVARAWIGADFFQPETDPDLDGLQYWAPQEAFGSGTHPSIYSWTDLQPVMLSIWWTPNPDYDDANRRALPILYPTAGPEAARVWTSEYPHWESMTSDYWADRCAWQPEDLPRAQWPTGAEKEFNMRALWELAFEAQTPNYGMSGGRFLESATGALAEEAGLHIDFQALVFQGDVPPSQFQFPDDSTKPPGLNTNPASQVGGFGGWVPHVEVSTHLSYTLVQNDTTNGWRRPPEDKFLNVGITMSSTPANPGDTFTVPFDGLWSNTLFVAEIDGNPANRLNVAVSAGDGPCEAVYQIPTGIPAGKTFQIVGTQDRDFLVPYQEYLIQ